MSKTLPCISVNDNDINYLRDYFFNTYKGEKFPIILKGSFYIEIFKDTRHVKFLISQVDDNTSITLMDENGNKKPISIIINGNKFIYDEKENSFIANTSVVTSISGFIPNIERYELELTDLYSYIVLFFSYEQENIPYSVVVCESKKKKKKIIRNYNLPKELLLEKVKLGFCDNVNYEDLATHIELNTSVLYSKKLEELMEKENRSYIEPLFIPFNEFVFSFDKNVTEIFCRVSESDKTLECVIFKSKKKLFAIKISLDKDPNNNFKIFTLDNFNKFASRGYTPFSLAKDIIHLMILNFFYFTHYKIIMNKVNTKKAIADNTNVVTHSNKKEIKSNKKSDTQKVYLGLNKKIYNISKSLESEIVKRKKPEYKKFSWQVRGHMRRLKSGKVIYISPYTCNRKGKRENINDNKKYIINI